MKIFFLVVALGAAACGASGGGETCSAFGSACPKGGTVEACCSQTQCRYLASDGSDFPCNGTDCTAALMQVTTWCTTH